MADGWATLGASLAGIDREGAFNEGRLRTAQTENALMLARKHQLANVAAEAEAEARARMTDELAKAGVKNPEMLGTALAGGYGNFDQVTQGGLNIQEQGFRDTLGNPTADPNAQFAAGQGVQGKMLNPYDAVGAGDYVDIRNPDAGLKPTPLGETMAAENQATQDASTALAELRRVQAGDPDYTTVSGAGSTTGGPGKPPAGFIANPNFDPTKPIGDGNYAYVDARAPQMGARESVFFNRIIGGARNAQQTIENIVGLKVGASAGVLGIGSKPGDNMFTATVDTLRNQVAPQDVQTYNTMIAGLDANLAQIEGHGLATSDSFRGQYDRLALREGDTEFTRLRKLAEMAQTIESGMEPYLSNPRIPQQQKQYVQEVVRKVRESIPFTHGDIALLEQEARPGRTLRDLINEKGLAGGAAPAVDPTAVAPTGADADGWFEVEPGVKVRVKPQGP